MKHLPVVCGVAVLVFSLLGVSSAALLPLAGELDPSFGNGGVVTRDLGGGEYPGIGGVAVQPDGKIVVAAGSVPGDLGLLLSRYLPNGSLDPSFGEGGYVETRVGAWAFARAIALQPDGKIVVAGASFQGDDNVLSEFTAARYTPDGSLDRSFGTDGVTNTVVPELPGFHWDAGADAVAVLPDGKILAAGVSEWNGGGSYSSAMAVARYTADGFLDRGFGDGGIAQTAFRVGPFAGVTVQPDGKIVIAGAKLARFTPDGSLDPTFGNGGSRKLRYTGGPVTLQGRKIVVTAYSSTNNAISGFPVLTRYESNGSLDPTFGQHGLAEIKGATGKAPFQGTPADVLAQSNGKLLIAGANYVVRLTPDGRLDKSFGSGGMLSLTGQVAASALAQQPDGKIVVAGSSGNTVQRAGTTWIVARLTGGNNCVVPALRRKTASTATATLKKSYCRRGRTTFRFSSKIARGQVISTEPARGTRLHSGARVNLVVSKGMRRP